VPVVLATFPVTAGVSRGDALFSIVFIVVLLTTVVQGSTLEPLARRLHLTTPEPARRQAARRDRRSPAEVVEYRVTPSTAWSPAGSPASAFRPMSSSTRSCVTARRSPPRDRCGSPPATGYGCWSGRAQPARGEVRYTITRKSAPHRGRVITRVVPAQQAKVSIRLPLALASGRYRVSAVVVDSLGSKSRTVSRALIVRSAHR
jgi:NhaP-type Na+/H+ or K+/H+ antiporter